MRRVGLAVAIAAAACGEVEPGTFSGTTTVSETGSGGAAGAPTTAGATGGGGSGGEATTTGTGGETASTGGAGGAGGQPEGGGGAGAGPVYCETALGCPTPAEPCEVAICVSHECATATTPNGAPGPSDGNDCTEDTCVGGAPLHETGPANVVCATEKGYPGVCDNSGNCICTPVASPCDGHCVEADDGCGTMVECDVECGIPDDPTGTLYCDAVTLLCACEDAAGSPYFNAAAQACKDAELPGVPKWCGAKASDVPPECAYGKTYLKDAGLYVYCCE